MKPWRSFLWGIVMLAASLSSIASNLHLATGQLAPREPTGRAGSPPEIPVLPSPIGFHPGNADAYLYLQELGAVWSREGTYLIWDWVDPDRSGRFSFRNAVAPPNPEVPGSGGRIDYDQLFASPPSWVRRVINFCPFRRGGSFNSEAEKDIFRDFVKSTVERYDGDDNLGCSQAAPDCYVAGDGEYPSEVVEAAFASNPVQVWQVCNQLTDTCEGLDCRDGYASAFAETQLISYEAVHEADPQALVLMAGDSAPEMYPPVYQALGGNRAMDIIDIHEFGQADDWDPRADLQILKDGLRSADFDPDSFSFWITESGTYSGDPVDDVQGTEGPPFQSEAAQAAGLVKRLTASIAAGVGRVFWAWNIVEGFGCDCCIFDYTGLVYDGNTPPNQDGCDANDPYDRGAGVKKLSYFSMARLIATLDGTTDVATIPGPESATIFRFRKEGRFIWVAWTDADEGERVFINTGAARKLQITNAVPSADYGEDVQDPATAFLSYDEIVNGHVALELGLAPVYVEEIDP